MKRKFTFLIAAAVMLLTMMATTGEMWGQNRDSYSYTFTAKVFDANNQTKTLNSVDWTFSGTGGDYFNYDGTKGQQFGSGNKPYSAFTLSTSGISGTITEIKVNTSGANNIAGTLNVTVGGNAFGNQYTLTNSATEATFSGSALGDIVFNYAQTSSKAIYIKSITVTYNTGGGTTPSISADDVQMGCDAQGTSIHYEIDNYVAGTMTATTEATWITSLEASTDPLEPNMGHIEVATTVNESASPRSATVTLTYTYNSKATVTKNVTVTQSGNPNAPGTENNPYTVAQARTAIDAGIGVTNVYATGIVSENVYYSEANHYITYNISADGLTTSDQLQAFHCRNINDTDFTSQDNIQVGDVVVIYGNLTKYNSTYEFADGNYLISLVRRPIITATPSPLVVPNYVVGTAEPEYETLTVNGSNLTANISLALNDNSNFEMSTDLTNWTSSLTLTQSEGSVTNADVAIRLKAGLAKGNYAGTVTLTSTNAEDVVVNLSGSVTGLSYTIESLASNGNITFDPVSPIEEGSVVTMTAVPADGYEFEAESWVFYNAQTLDIVVVPVTDGNKITMPAYNLAVDATFNAKQTYAITKVVTPDNSGTVETDIEAWEGKTVTVLVEAANGYAFSNIVISKTGEPETTIPTTGSAASGFTFTMPGYAVTATATFEEKTQVTYNFSEIDGFGDWGSSYDEHVVEYTDATVTFASANHSSSTITDIPVTKGNPVSIELKNGITLTGATFVCRQWSNKAQTITLHYSTDGGENYTATTPTSTNFTITNNALADGTNAVRITFSSQSNQVGIESATLRFAGQKHAITLASVSNGTISADKTSASANQIVTLTATPNQGYAFDTWTVYKTGDIQTSITVENNQFVMPNYPVTVSATFAASYPITFSVNGSTTIQNYVQGSLITLPIPTENIPSGYSFVGWTDDEEDVSTLLSSYIVNSAATLYAVFVKTDSITITGDGFGTYSDEEVTINGITYGVNQVMKSNSNQIQIKASVGYLYNKDAFNNMISIVATQSGTHRDVTLKVGTTENPDEGTTIAPTTKDMIDSYSIPENMTYFVLTNTSGNALYYSSIVFNFSDPTSSRYTRVYPSGNIEPDEDITIITPTVISSGTVLNMGTYDLECTDPANLIIEDGGQVIVNNTGVQATFKKSVAHGGAKDAANWYTISSPVNNIATASVTNLIQDPATKYDLYYYDEATQMWKNHKANAITNMTNGRGYLYWNTDGDELSFPGELNSGNVEIAVTTTGTGDLAGFNLIGNPYSHNIYKGDGTAIPNSILSAGYYTLSNAGAWTAGTDNTTAIKPGQGILVKATAAGTVTMTNTTANGAKRNNEFIKFMIANSQYEDVAYALFNDEEGLNKINHRNADIPMLYIPQDGQNYAIATMSDETQSFNLNLRVMTTGQYTLSFKAEGKYDYLHVIDRMTGEDIDMLLNGEYSFIASPSDNDARFIVKLGYNTNNSVENNLFAYQNNNDIIVNGEGELQVFDVMGRMISTQHVNGVQTIEKPSQTGVYIFKLNEKTQKIVVR